MLFSEIIGQQDIKARLVRTVVEQRIPHAQLLRGPAGVGKLGLAIAYAQYICCENKNSHRFMWHLSVVCEVQKNGAPRPTFCFSGD